MTAAILQKVRDRLVTRALVQSPTSRGGDGELRVAVPLLGMRVETEVGDDGVTAIVARFERVSAPQGAEPPWALVLDNDLRASLSALGVDTKALHRKWPLNDGGEEALIDEMHSFVGELLRMPVQIVRGTDLPIGLQWPQSPALFGDSANVAASPSDLATLDWWRHGGREVIAREPIAELRSVELSAAAAVARGLPPLRIGVNASAAGLVARPFPDQDVYLILNGPPGAPLNIFIWSREEQSADLGAAIREMLVPGWMKVLDLGDADTIEALGASRRGVLFMTGAGPSRTAWFAFPIYVATRRVIVMLGVDGRGAGLVSARDMLGNRAIAAALGSLRIDGR